MQPGCFHRNMRSQTANAAEKGTSPLGEVYHLANEFDIPAKLGKCLKATSPLGKVYHLANEFDIPAELGKCPKDTSHLEKFIILRMNLIFTQNLAKDQRELRHLEKFVALRLLWHSIGLGKFNAGSKTDSGFSLNLGSFRDCRLFRHFESRSLRGLLCIWE